MSSVVIDEIRVADRGKKLEPLRIQFEHCHAALTPESLEITKSGIYSDNLDTNEYIAVCQVEDQHYVGSTKGQNHNENQTLYIALKNKDTNKIKLVEISTVVLSPVVQYPLATNSVLTDDDYGIHKRGRKVAFAQRFGVLKIQRVFDQAERFTVKTENVEMNLENAANSTIIQSSELDLSNSVDSYEELLPQRNSDSKLASQVYQIENIVSLNEMADLEENTVKLMNDDPDVQVEKLKQFSHYFTKEFKRLNSANLDKDSKLKYLKALLYTEGLIKFSAIKKKSISLGVLHESLPEIIPECVKTSIQQKYSCKEGRIWTLSQVCRDKIICHAIALALVIGNCSIDAESFSSSVKLDMKLLESLIRVVGARMEKNKSGLGFKIILKIPLALPPHKRGMNKRKSYAQ